MRPQQSGSPGRGNMFTRYAGEQVQQIPAGYVEGMSSYGRMAQQVGSSIAGMIGDQAKLEVAKKQGTIDVRKADALEEANRLKEKGLDIESAYKAYSLKSAAENTRYEQVKDAHKVLGGVIAGLKAKLEDPEVSEEEKGKAKLELQQANVDYQGFSKKMITYANEPIITFDTWQDSQKKLKESKPRNDIPRSLQYTKPEETPETIKTSYYQSPAFQTPAYTAQGSDVTKTVAFGGSPKKVEVVGGRVSSVVSPDGTKSRVGGWVSEDDLPAINQVVTALESSSAGNAYGTPSGSETPGPTPAPVEQRVELDGPLNSRYINTEPLEAIDGSTNRNKRNGTIVYDERKSPSTGEVTRTPRIAFNSKYLQNADGSENIDAHMSLRRLAMMNDVLLSGEYKDIKPDQSELNAADDEFGTKDNAFDMPAIRKAYAYVDRNINNKRGGDTPALMWGLKFEQKYGMAPSQFMASGDSATELEITPSVMNALEATRRGRLAARIAEVGSAPTRPEGLDESIKSNDVNIARIEEALARTTKTLSDPMIAGTDQETTYKNKQGGLMKELEVAKTKGTQLQNKIANSDVDLKRYQQKADAIGKELAVDESVMRLEAGKRDESKDIEKLVERWVGITPSDWQKTNGFVAISLQNVPKATSSLPIIINGKDTGKFYSDRLDAAELLAKLEKNRDFDAIKKITRGMPTVDQLYNKDTGIYESQKKFNDALSPIKEINRLNNVYINMAKSGVTGTLKVQFEKLWQSEPEMSSAGTLQKTLIGAIRQAVVGPGNPSNYEQEVLASIIPDVNEFMSRPERVKARIKALATITMFSHYNNMVANGLEPTDMTLKMYSKQLGSVLGYEVTKEVFAQLYDNWDKQRAIYTTNQSAGSENKDLAREYASRLIDSLEERAKPATKPAK